MLDETISRVVRTPYKYLDLSHSQYQDTSIFNVALIEQFKFILNKRNHLMLMIKMKMMLDILIGYLNFQIFDINW